jgi:hypothetical protein
MKTQAKIFKIPATSPHQFTSTYVAALQQLQSTFLLVTEDVHT